MATYEQLFYRGIRIEEAESYLRRAFNSGDIRELTDSVKSKFRPPDVSSPRAEAKILTAWMAMVEVCRALRAGRPVDLGENWARKE